MSSKNDVPDIGIDPVGLARAEAALAGLSQRYLSWADADLARLEDCLTQLLARPEDRTELLGRAFGIAHDMKGQGATFDYPLISEFGNRLCRVLEACPRPGAEDLEQVAVLVAAMGRVLRERLSGDGGDEGRRLLSDRL
ncbi:MAG: Hpt domain-containing protein [Phaeospirillum sp.]|nr:Hpt domain-containing protein [Phaeospirillum sp.]